MDVVRFCKIVVFSKIHEYVLKRKKSEIPPEVCTPFRETLLWSKVVINVQGGYMALL